MLRVLWLFLFQKADVHRQQVIEGATAKLSGVTRKVSWVASSPRKAPPATWLTHQPMVDYGDLEQVTCQASQNVFVGAYQCQVAAALVLSTQPFGLFPFMAFVPMLFFLYRT